VLGDLLSHQPQLMTVLGDLFFKNLDGPSHLEMAERIKVILDPKVQQMLASKQQGGTVPPAVQAQLLQLQQQIQEAEKVLQAQHTELQTRQAEQQTKLQIAQLQADQAIKLREMQDATAIAVARINAVKGAVIADNEQQIEREALGAEAARTAMQQAHEARMKGHDLGAEHAHDIASQ